MEMRNVSGFLAVTLLVLLLSPCSSVALWPQKAPETRGEAATEYAKEAVRDTADAAKNVGESIKQTANAAYETTADAAKTVTGSKDSTDGTYRDSAGRYVEESRGRAADAVGTVRDSVSRGAQTITGGRQDHGSAGSTGAAYRDATGRYVADSAAATQNKASEVAEAAKDTAARATQTVADTARSAGEKASQAATATKDAAVDTAQAAKERAAQAYDSTAETLGSTSDKVSETAGSTKERVWGTPDSEKTYTQRAREMAAQTGETAQGHASYAGEKLSESAQTAADATRRAGQNVRDGTARAYDSTTNTLGTPVRDQRGVMDKAGDYLHGAKDSVADAAGATKDTAYRTMGYEAPSDQKGYASSTYEAGKEKLGNIVEVLGWRKVAADQHEHVKRSPYDVLVGNDRYVWHQRPAGDDSYYQKAKDTLGGATERRDDSYYQKARDTLGGATETSAAKAGEVKDRTVDAASRAKDAVVDSANRAKESVKDVTGQGEKKVTDYSQRGKEAIGAGAAALGAHRLAKMGRFSKVLAFLNLLAYAVTFGSAVWMTFISGSILSRTIPQEQFRNVQTKMFPYFLKFMVSGEAALVALYALMNGFSSKWLFGLLFLLATTAYNAFVLEPKTTKIYLEKLRTEKEEGTVGMTEKQSAKQKKFNEVHGFSAILNLLSLVGLTYHGWNMVPALLA